MGASTLEEEVLSLPPRERAKLAERLGQVQLVTPEEFERRVQARLK
jgi:hypothetical protein